VKDHYNTRCKNRYSYLGDSPGGFFFPKGCRMFYRDGLKPIEISSRRLYDLFDVHMAVLDGADVIIREMYSSGV